MIRSTRLRLLCNCTSSRATNRPSATTYSSCPRPTTDSHETEDAKARDQSKVFEEAYGNAYGAGSSRHPYIRPRQAPPPPPIDNATSGRESKHQPSPAERAAYVRLKTSFGDPPTLESSHIQMILDGQRRDISDGMTRIEVVVLINHSIALGHPILAARLMLWHIKKNLKLRPPGGMFRRATVNHVFTAATGSAFSSYNNDPKARSLRRGTEDVDVLLPLLSALQEVRNHRGIPVYTYLIQRLCAEGLYDTAAKVYVEQVEEWITEGRIALGADPRSFAEGGGPPKTGRESWEIRLGLYKTWWKGVRTWILPGEVLSPHDRLDLWHPRKLKLPERLRKFPMPTPDAPNSIVPHPNYRSLMTIADHLELDPETASPEAFTRSMRASAILASTILSRTLPYLPARFLQDVLDKTPSHPPVFPEGYKGQTKGQDAWAYTAHTHIHLAIRSVLLSPPVRPALFKYLMDFDKAKSEGLPLPQVPLEYRYQTAPLSYAACVFLSSYAVKRLFNPTAIKALYNYVLGTWGPQAITKFHGLLMRTSSLLPKKDTAVAMDKFMMQNTAIAHDASPLSVRSPRPKTILDEVKIDEVDKFWQSNDVLAAGQTLDEKKLAGFLAYLTATSQGDRFIDSVYKIIAYLQYSKKLDPQLIGDPEGILTQDGKNGAKLGDRPISPALTPRLYGQIMNGLANFGAVNLGQRVYRLAIHQEKMWRQEHAGQLLPKEYRLRIDVYTSMIRLWHISSVTTRNAAARKDFRFNVHVRPPTRPKMRSYDALIWRVYRSARLRWKEYSKDEVDETRSSQRDFTSPDPRFFNIVIRALSKRWGTKPKEGGFRQGLTQPPRAGRSGIPGYSFAATKEVLLVASDIKEQGCEIPKILQIRAGLVPPMSKEEANGLTNHQLGRAIRVLDKSKMIPGKGGVFIYGPSVEAEMKALAEHQGENTVESLESEYPRQHSWPRSKSQKEREAGMAAMADFGDDELVKKPKKDQRGTRRTITDSSGLMWQDYGDKGDGRDEGEEDRYSKRERSFRGSLT